MSSVGECIYCGNLGGLTSDYVSKPTGPVMRAGFSPSCEQPCPFWGFSGAQILLLTHCKYT
jgi:hypothetical protein